MLSVLYVDDDESLLSLGKLFLERSGSLRIDTALSASEAIGKLACRRYDGIISDYQMPGTDGIALLKNVRARFGQIPFVLFTGKGREEMIIEALNNGADGYVQKGCDPASQFAELENAIRRFVGQKRAEDDLLVLQQRIVSLKRVAASAMENSAAGSSCPDGAGTVACPGGMAHGPGSRQVPVARERISELVRTCNELKTEKELRRKAEAELRERDKKFKKLFNISNDAICFLQVLPGGRVSRVLDMNDAMSSLLGYSREKLLRMSRGELDAHGLAGLVDAIEQNAQELTQALFESEIVRNDGTTISVEVTETTSDFSGVAVVFVSIRDITERKMAKEALLQANRKLTLLSSITRHDILNKLTVLMGYQALVKKQAEDPLQKEYLEKGEKAIETIRQLISFTKDYEELGNTAPLWQDLGATIRRAAGSAGTVQAAVEVPAGMDGIEIHADPLLEKVFFNLVENSIRHGGKVTRIAFSCTESDAGLCIVCEDDGTGIPLAEKENIFCRQYFHHTGLGMSLSREILALTGLSIRETGEEGSGARFEIVVPKGAYRLPPAPGPAPT